MTNRDIKTGDLVYRSYFAMSNHYHYIARVIEINPYSDLFKSYGIHFKLEILYEFEDQNVHLSEPVVGLSSDGKLEKINVSNLSKSIQKSILAELV